MKKMTDNLYFKNGTVWYNCKLLQRVGNSVEVDFIEKYDRIIAKKQINKIYGIVITDFDTTKTTIARSINTASFKSVKNLEKIEYVNIKMKGSDNLISQIKYTEQKEAIKETKPLFEKLNYPNYMNGLGLYSQTEMLNIFDQKDKISESDKILYYYSKRKHAVPECLMNGYGLASMSQGDYGFGALILVTELVGTIIISSSLDPGVRTVGYVFLGAGGIAGIIRPIVYSSNYNNALKIGLEINYEF